MSAAREVRVERLVGTRVRAKNGRVIGRIEEVLVEGGRNTVTEFHLGAAGLWERLGRVRLLFRAHEPHGLAAAWDQVDLTDPEHPRLLCTVDELRRLEAGEPPATDPKKAHLGRRPKGR
jgi:hypothetical protein